MASSLSALVWLSFKATEWQHLPNRPGVYRFYNEKGDLLYVGKSKKLHRRVGDYFRKDQGANAKTRHMVQQIHHIMYTEVGSEHDALLLENNLIKAHQPKYNILLRDDKNYPYICVTNEDFPRIFITRRRQKQHLYIGPYTHNKGLRHLIEHLQRMFMIRSCNYDLSPQHIETQKYKVCLEYHLGNCKGPCEGLQNASAYQIELQQAISILKGKVKSVENTLRQSLSKAVSTLDYEEAQHLKEKISALEQFKSRSIIVSPHLGSLDVCTLSRRQSTLYINYMQVVDGRIVISNTYQATLAIEEQEADIFSLLLIQLREKHTSEHREVLVNLPIQSWSKDLRIHCPKQGDKKKLVELSLQNLLHRQSHEPKKDPQKRGKKILRQLQRVLRLPQCPDYIECFDISNLQAAYTVGVMVCFRDGKASKKEYRHFHIRSLADEAPNDYAAMEELIRRRYARLLKEKKPIPDLIIIDGGKGQLNTAQNVIRQLNIKTPIIGLAKRMEEVFLPGASEALLLDLQGDSIKLLQRIRNETHRVAISFHRHTRSKNALTSALEEIPGIGTVSRMKLIKTFGSLKEIRSATQRSLRLCIGKHRATLLHKALHPD